MENRDANNEVVLVTLNDRCSDREPEIMAIENDHSIYMNDVYGTSNNGCIIVDEEMLHVKNIYNNENVSMTLIETDDDKDTKNKSRSSPVIKYVHVDDTGTIVFNSLPYDSEESDDVVEIGIDEIILDPDNEKIVIKVESIDEEVDNHLRRLNLFAENIHNKQRVASNDTDEAYELLSFNTDSMLDNRLENMRQVDSKIIPQETLFTDEWPDQAYKFTEMIENNIVTTERNIFAEEINSQVQCENNTDLINKECKTTVIVEEQDYDNIEEYISVEDAIEEIDPSPAVITRNQIMVMCNICNTIFRNRTVLQSHLSSHIQPAICEKCGLFFDQDKSLIKHYKSHEKNMKRRRSNYYCSHCDKNFTKRALLKNHRLNAHNIKDINNYMCRYCGKNISTRLSLSIHERIHTGVKPFICESCGQAFRSKANLLQHQPTHTGIKRYTCPVCNKAFSRKAFVLTHMRVHTGERPYPCDICGNRYTQVGDMRRHRKRHVDNLTAPIRYRKHRMNNSSIPLTTHAVDTDKLIKITVTNEKSNYNHVEIYENLPV